jgi:hypothetical protein
MEIAILPDPSLGGLPTIDHDAVDASGMLTDPEGEGTSALTR